MEKSFTDVKELMWKEFEILSVHFLQFMLICLFWFIWIKMIIYLLINAFMLGKMYELSTTGFSDWAYMRKDLYWSVKRYIRRTEETCNRSNMKARKYCLMQKEESITKHKGNSTPSFHMQRRWCKVFFKKKKFLQKLQSLILKKG